MTREQALNKIQVLAQKRQEEVFAIFDGHEYWLVNENGWDEVFTGEDWSFSAEPDGTLLVNQCLFSEAQSPLSL